MPRIQGRLFAAGIRFLVHASAFLSENDLGRAVLMNDANMAVTIGLYHKHASPAMIHLVSSQNSQFPLYDPRNHVLGHLALLLERFTSWSILREAQLEPIMNCASDHARIVRIWSG